MENTEGSILDRGSIHSFPTMSPNKKGGSKKLWILIVLIAVAVAAFLFLRPSETTIQKPTPTIEPTTIIEEPPITDETSTTPTTEPTKDVKKTATGPKIQVQNGSGAEGVAGKMQTALSDSGYDNVETTNADNFDYTEVTIKAKDASMETAKKIKTQLKDYSFAEEVATLSDDSDFDIVLIVGK
jgi:hypothetical protein